MRRLAFLLLAVLGSAAHAQSPAGFGLGSLTATLGDSGSGRATGGLHRFAGTI